MKPRIQRLPDDPVSLLLLFETKEILPFIKFKRYRRAECGRNPDKIIDCWLSDLRYDGNRFLKESLQRHFLHTEKNPFEYSVPLEAEPSPEKDSLEQFARLLLQSGLSAHHCKKIFRTIYQTKTQLYQMDAHWLWDRLSQCVKRKKGSPAEHMQAVKMVWTCLADEPFFLQNRQKWADWMKELLIRQK